jgi:hypothetical protein
MRQLAMSISSGDLGMPLADLSRRIVLLGGLLGAPSRARRRHMSQGSGAAPGRHLGARQPFPQHRPALLVDAVHLEHALGDVQPERGNLHVDVSLRGLSPTSPWHTDAAGGVHLIMRPWASA